MNRKQLLQSLALVSGHAMFPSVLSSFITSCTNRDMSAYAPTFFTAEQYKAITKIIDIIIPATKTKSASQTNTQVFLDQVFSTCLTSQEQDSLKTGIKKLIAGFEGAKDKFQFVL